MAAGAADGINPCAFATIVFFVSLLTVAGKGKREILLTGAFFSLAVFMTYLFLGLGVLSLLQELKGFALASKVMHYSTAVVAFGLGVLSIYDTIVYKKTEISERMVLQLPRHIKQHIHSILREGITTKRLAVTALITGFLVSLLESVCTGQMYLPTIVFVLKEPGLASRGWLYLILYNLMFVMPLICIFCVSYLGIGSKRLSAFTRSHLAVAKAVSAIMFISIAILIII